MATLESILAEVQVLRQLVDDLPSRIEIASNQIVVISGLSDIDHRLGLVTAGEFRTGNGVVPGDGFTGVRIGYPAFTYGSSTWHIAGVNNDVIQFGLRATDGAALFGAGTGLIDASGLLITSTAQRIYLQADGDAFFGSNLAAAATTSFVVFSNAQTYNSESMGAGDVLLGDNTASKANMLWDVSESVVRFRGGTTSGARIETDGTIFVANSSFINFEASGGGAVAAASIGATGSDDLQLVATGSTIYLYATSVQIEKQAPAGAVFATFSTSNIVLNEDSSDINFRVETNGDANMLFVDGGADRIGIGTGTPAVGLEMTRASTAEAIMRITDTGASGSAAGGAFQVGSNDGAAMASGDRLGSMRFLGHDGIGVVSGALMEAVTVEAWTGTAHGNRLIFYTVPVGSTVLTAGLIQQSDQTLKLNSANSWTANGTGTVTISNLAPAGVGTATISKWLTITDNAGVVMYVPCWT